MIIPDTNLLLYATVDAFPHHARARAWWEATLSGRDSVGLAPVVITAFVRLATKPAVFTDPMDIEQALSHVEEWRARPMVQVLTSDTRHLDATCTLLRQLGTAGNLTTDAQIAAHALLEQATVASNDTDFGRFPDVRVANPLVG